MYEPNRIEWNDCIGPAKDFIKSPDNISLIQRFLLCEVWNTWLGQGGRTYIIIRGIGFYTVSNLRSAVPLTLKSATWFKVTACPLYKEYSVGEILSRFDQEEWNMLWKSNDG